LSEEQLIRAILNVLGWIASADPAFVSPKNNGYKEEEDIGMGAIVERAGKKKAKEAEGTGWFSSVTSYFW
jgi:hypothetical protein